MASCNVKNKPYGYWCGDVGTDATTVTSNTVKVKGVLLVSGASARTLTITDGASDTIVTVVTTASGAPWVFNYDLYGQRFEGLKVTLATSTTDRILIFTE